MKSVSTRGYRFQVQIDNFCKDKTFPKNTWLATAEKTLNAIPLRVLRAQLSKSSVNHLNLMFVGTKRIQRLNQQYRGKNRPTDVLSFSRIEGLKWAPLPEMEIGDVIICRAVAEKNVKQDGTPIDHEIRTLIIHGILHVFGYDHEKNQTDAKRMFRLQKRILQITLE